MKKKKTREQGEATQNRDERKIKQKRLEKNKDGEKK